MALGRGQNSFTWPAIDTDAQRAAAMLRAEYSPSPPSLAHPYLSPEAPDAAAVIPTTPTCVALGDYMALLTREQLITEVGGPTKAAELCPDRTTGGINYTILDAAIADAIGDVDAACAKFYADLSTNPPQKLVRIARQIGAYYLWLKAAAGKTMPENVAKAFGGAKQDLRDIEASDSLPGRDATYRFPSAIDNSYGGRRAVYSTFRRSGLLGSR